MKSTSCGNDFISSGEARNLYRRFVGLGARVAEKYPRAGIVNQILKLLGQFDTRFVRIEITHMSQFPDLVGDSVDDDRVRMS